MINQQLYHTDTAKEADKLLLSRFVAPNVIINKNLQILRSQGNLFNYLQPSACKANSHLLEILRDELAFELSVLIDEAKRNNEIVCKKEICLNINNIPTPIAVEVMPLKSNYEDTLFLIVFQEKMLFPFQDINGEVSENRWHTINKKLTLLNEKAQNQIADLKQSVGYAEAIIETIQNPLIVLNADLRIGTANKAFYVNFKLNPKEAEGNYFYAIADGQWNIKELKNKLSKIITENKKFEPFELTHEFDQLGKKTLLFRVIKMNQESEKSKYLLSIEDITERKRSEELIKQSEEKLRLLIKNAFDVILIISADGKIIFGSESIEEVLGYKRTERMGINVFEDSIFHPDDIAGTETIFKEIVSQPNKKVKIEFRLLHKDGNYRWMEASCTNLIHDPYIQGIVVVYRDVTECRMLEKQKDQFIGIASHELKTPVTSIKGYTQILQKLFEKSDSQQAIDLLKKMDVQVDRLTNLIKDLLDVTQISEGQLKLKQEVFDINELINEVADEIQWFSLKHSIIKNLQSVPLVTADKERIRQVIVNLLSNGIKYSPNADKVIISSMKNENGIVVSVEDFGIGIDQSVQGKVFDRFFRDIEPSINTYPGLGLGLYISSEIIKRQHGRIWLTSQKNDGSTFSFFLPVESSIG